MTNNCNTKSFTYLDFLRIKRYSYVSDNDNILYISWHKSKTKKKAVSYLSYWQSPNLFFSSSRFFTIANWIEESWMHACDELIELLFFFFLLFFIYIFSIEDRYYFMPPVCITKTYSIYMHTYCLMVPAV